MIKAPAKFWKKMFAVTGELVPCGQRYEHHASHLGVVDSCNITDNQTAIVRTSSIATANSPDID